MYALLTIVLVASVAVTLTSAANTVSNVPDFQVYEGSEAKFAWKYTVDTGSFTSAKWYDNDDSTEMMTVTGSATPTVDPSFTALIEFISSEISLGMTIKSAADTDSGTYKVAAIFSDSETPVTESTKLTVVTAAGCDDFKKATSLKINNKQTVSPGDTVDDVDPGEVSLELTVPDDYTQTTTCTHTSSDTKSPCGASCIAQTCTYTVSTAIDSDVIEIKILIDGLSDDKSYGFTVKVKEAAEKKTAGGSKLKPSQLFITGLAVIGWFWL